MFHLQRSRRNFAEGGLFLHDERAAYSAKRTASSASMPDPRLRHVILLFATACLAGAGSAWAQQGPGRVPPLLGQQDSQPAQTLSLSAVFAGENKPVLSGLVWRVFRERDDGRSDLVERSNEASPNFRLPPGNYILHAAYGFAGTSRRIALRGGSAISERLTLGAGALRLSAAIGDTPIPSARMTFSIFVPIGNNSEGRLVASGVRVGDLVRLPEGTYHVVSSYGDTNSIMRADLKVDSGQVTQATLNHRAATVTLKLVNAIGGEALAGTAFSVLTPGGDVIREVFGAFPQMVLAEGDYVVIARQDGQVFTLEFKVESGLDRDIEVLAR